MPNVYIMARLDISGPVPMVVNVNSYSSANICFDHIKYRMWVLVSADSHEEAEEKLQVEHAWAMCWYHNVSSLPYSGR